MAPPDTNLEKQERRHKGPLIGITLVLIFAVIMAFVWSGGEEITDEDAQDGEAQIEETSINQTGIESGDVDPEDPENDAMDEAEASGN